MEEDNFDNGNPFEQLGKAMKERVFNPLQKNIMEQEAKSYIKEFNSLTFQYFNLIFAVLFGYLLFHMPTSLVSISDFVSKLSSSFSFGWGNLIYLLVVIFVMLYPIVMYGKVKKTILKKLGIKNAKK